MRDIILKKLKAIEKDEGVKILLAVESGSRAWGFESANSDYDVRFIYARPHSWYLSLLPGRDVLEYPIDELLDIHAWDLPKALLLLAKSNPPLNEWLDSPIVYLRDEVFFSEICELAKSYFNPRACMYHYLSMAKNNYHTYLCSEKVNLKKYFYTLRPILACRWIEINKSMPPTLFEELVSSMVNDTEEKNEIYKLQSMKKKATEAEMIPPNKMLNTIIEQKITHYTNIVGKVPTTEDRDYIKLNKYLLTTLNRLWGDRIAL